MNRGAQYAKQDRDREYGGAVYGLGVKISGKTARGMVKDALEKIGMEPWPEMEVELFVIEDALLLIARPRTYWSTGRR